LNNLYPIPTREKVEKIRRKWYKKNKDKEFDVDFNAEEHVEKKAQEKRASPGMSD